MTPQLSENASSQAADLRMGSIFARQREAYAKFSTPPGSGLALTHLFRYYSLRLGGIPIRFAFLSGKAG
jgi:hypothetical protein